VRAVAAQCAVLRHPALNQVLLHARQQGLAIVQRQAGRIEWRWGSVPLPRATSWVCFFLSTLFSSIVTRQPIPAHGLPAAEVSTPFWDGLRRIQR
jgi:hypothetical protein